MWLPGVWETQMSVDAALFSGSKCYFFDGNRYIRVTRGDVGAGTVDPGYPLHISNWNWPAGFGSNGIDAALYSGSKSYFFDGNRYIRVTRGDVGAGTVDPGYPASITNWGWPRGFAGAPGPTVRLHAKILTAPNVGVNTSVQRMRELYESHKIIRQALDRLKPGPTKADAPKVVLPDRDDMRKHMDSLIHHFLIVAEGFNVPEGEVYLPIEGSKGELGVYMKSNGGPKPDRVHVRGPSFVNLSALPAMSEGEMIADVVAIIGSLDIVLGEIDR